MTIWEPDLAERPGPKYLALADALAADVSSGALPPGTRLPTHRELADRLHVTVGTVSRGYAEALRRGLIRGEVGRGTFVHAPRTERNRGHWLCVPQFADPETLALHYNTPTGDESEVEIRAALADCATSEELGPLLHYQHSAGVESHRAAGAEWLRRMGHAATADDVVIAAGGQHAINLAFAALTNPGDVILTESFVYQGVTNAAQMLHLRAVGVRMDDDGILPDEFAAACKRYAPKAVYLTPTFQNPTASVMPVARRREIADIAIQHGVKVIEDDIYAFYLDEPLPTVASMVGDLGYFLSSTSKSIAPGLRIAFVHAPAHAVSELVDTLWSTTIMASPLTSALAARLIENGSIETIFARRREVAARRQKLVDERFGEFVASSCDRRCTHVWVDLPEPWRSSEFVRAAEQRRVAVAPAELFAVGRTDVPHSIRLSLSAVRDDADLARGLDVVADLLRSSPHRARRSM